MDSRTKVYQSPESSFQCLDALPFVEVWGSNHRAQILEHILQQNNNINFKIDPVKTINSWNRLRKENNFFGVFLFAWLFLLIRLGRWNLTTAETGLKGNIMYLNHCVSCLMKPSASWPDGLQQKPTCASSSWQPALSWTNWPYRWTRG